MTAAEDIPNRESAAERLPETDHSIASRYALIDLIQLLLQPALADWIIEVRLSAE